MKTIIVSIISGAIGAAIFSNFIQPTFADDVSERAKEMLANGICNVSVDFGRLTPGPRCFSNEVMVGFAGNGNNNIYCSNIQVTCN